MTSVTAMVPMRHSSERVPGKNYRPLGGVPLYHHVIRALLAVPEITQVVIDTDSPIIFEDAAKAFPDVILLERPEHLRAGEIPMNDVLLHTTSQVPSDLYLQTHSTNPFLKAETIQRGLRQLLDAGDRYDSLFGVSRIQARLWDKDTRPVNHDPKVLLRTQDLDPIYLENSCIYVFSPDTLRTYGNRIGARPLMFEIPPDEAVDIDEESDFTLAEQLWAIRHPA
jgi:CMP-N-acetylneuraminic acid synthetase